MINIKLNNLNNNNLLNHNLKRTEMDSEGKLLLASTSSTDMYDDAYLNSNL